MLHFGINILVSIDPIDTSHWVTSHMRKLPALGIPWHVGIQLAQFHLLIQVLFWFVFVFISPLHVDSVASGPAHHRLHLQRGGFHLGSEPGGE